jgi:hypothetical protein
MIRFVSLTVAPEPMRKIRKAGSVLRRRTTIPLLGPVIVSARGEADRGARRVVNCLTQRALAGVADAVARIDQAVNHLLTGGVERRAGCFPGRRGRGRLVLAAGDKHQEREQEWQWKESGSSD